MEKLELRLQDAQKVLVILQQTFQANFDHIIRDATIQRFKNGFEAFWKFIREYLKEKEGVTANSPKACFREIFSLGFCSEAESVHLMEMTDRRNETVHTYKEAVAKKIYKHIKKDAGIMQQLLKEIAKR